MKWTTWAALLLCLMLVPATCLGAASEARVIQVEGRGMVAGAPDQAVIHIGVVSSAPTAHEAEQKNARAARQIQERLLSMGVGKEKINTSRFTFYPVYREDKGRQHEIAAYTVDNTVDVTIEDLKLVGDVIDSSIEAGANTIHSISFQIKNDKQLKKAALEYAVADAREKAGIIAGALGRRIVGVIRAEEGAGGARAINYAYSELKRSAGQMDAATPVAPGSIDVSASVSVAFEIE